MTVFGLGPRAGRVLDALRQRILSEDLPEGTKLPSHAELATAYGVAPLTMRQVLARLEQEGLVQREQGRGTFVRRPVLPGILIVEAEPEAAARLADYVSAMAVRPIVASSPAEALEVLSRDRGVAVVVSDVHVPTPAEGLAFIRAVRRRWADLPLVAVTTHAEDLAPLHGTPEWPVLVVSTPFVPHQMRQALDLAMAAGSRANGTAGAG